MPWSTALVPLPTVLNVQITSKMPTSIAAVPAPNVNVQIAAPDPLKVAGIATL